MPGGACHKGELTLLGQRQVGGQHAAARMGTGRGTQVAALTLGAGGGGARRARLGAAARAPTPPAPPAPPPARPQALDLGRWLRQAYGAEPGFLPAAYEPGAVAARATKYARTRATLRGVLTGARPGAAGAACRRGLRGSRAPLESWFRAGSARMS
jgi:hypothetical protein